MLWIVFTVLMAVVIGATVVVSRLGAFRAVERTFQDYRGNTVVDRKAYDYTGKVLVGVVGGVLTLWLLVSAVASFHQVPAGHVGLVYFGGDIVGETDSGIQFTAPWQSLRTVNAQIQVARFHASDDKSAIKDGLTQISAGSIETQNIYIDATVNYQLDRGHVRALYTATGPQWFSRLIPSRVHQFFKAEIVKYGAVEVTQKREQIREAVTKALDAELAPYGISVVAVQIDNIGYSSEFDQAIERKQVATQDALRAQEIVAQKEAEARQKVAEAKGAADSAVEAARGRAESVTIEANAQAQANRELSQSLTPALLQYRALDKVQGTSVAILPSGSGYLLDPSTLLGQLQKP